MPRPLEKWSRQFATAHGIASLNFESGLIEHHRKTALYKALRGRMAGFMYSHETGQVLATDKVRDYGGCRGVEADNIQHSRVVRVGDGELVRHHAHHNELRRDAGLCPVFLQRLYRMDFPGPSFAVGV